MADFPPKRKGTDTKSGEGRLNTLEIRPILPPGQTKPNPGSGRAEPGQREFTAEDTLTGYSQEAASLRFRKPSRSRFPNLRPYRNLFYALAIFVGLGATLSLTLRYSPQAQEVARTALGRAERELAPYGWEEAVQSVAKALDAQIANWQGKPGSTRSSEIAWGDMDCRFLIEEALSRRVKASLDTEGRYLLLSCQLARDMPQVAVRNVFETHGDPIKLQHGVSSWDLVAEQLIAAEAQRRLHALEVRAVLRFPSCQQWSGNPACLLRFVDGARDPWTNRSDAPFSTLEPVIAQKSVRLQAWFYWAAGLGAMKAMKKQQAEKHLAVATEKLRTTREPFLQREIFRSRVRNAWIHRDRELLRTVWKSRPKAEIKADREGYLDALLMHTALVKPSEQARELAYFFSRPESYQRYRFDPFFVRWIIDRAIRLDLSAAAQTYLNRLTLSADTPERSSEELSILRVRLALARGEPLDALRQIQALERFAQRSQEVLHLKGLAMLRAYNTKPYRMFAAQELQKAVNAGARFESYFAMILAFLEAREWVKAEATLSFWKRDKLRSSEVVWINFASGLIRYARGDHDAARKIWRDLGAAHPDFEVVRKLEQNLSEDPGYLQNQLLNQLLLLLPPDSPIGPLALFSQRA